MTLLLNAVVSISTHENCHCITFVSKNTVDLRFCMIYQRFLSHRLCILYRLFHVLFSEKSLSKEKIFVFSLTLWQLGWGILVKRARKTFFDIANVLNTTILPSNVRFFILHKFKTPCIFQMLKNIYGLLFSDCKRSIHLRFW